MACDEEAFDNLALARTLLLSRPYGDCPECGGRECFGYSKIRRNRLTRLCVRCQHEEREELPVLHKKVLYLDQFVVSNILKAKDRQQSGGLTEDDKRWLRLLRQISHLTRLQILICPHSDSHRRESSLWKHKNHVEPIYRGICGDRRFRSFEEIRVGQLRESVRAWVQGIRLEELRHDRATAFRRDVDEWFDKGGTFVTLPGFPDFSSDIREAKKQRQSALREYVRRCGQEAEGFGGLFCGWIERERSCIINTWNRYVAQSRSDIIPSGEEFVWPTGAVSYVDALQYELRCAGASATDVSRKVQEYLNSVAFEYVPFVRIRAALYAALGKKAASGQKCVSASLADDFDMVSTLLPYCDFMLLDNACAGLLSEEPVRSSLDFGCRIFCPRTIPQIGEVLGDLQDNASEEHLAKVREVYGSQWLRPCDGLEG